MHAAVEHLASLGAEIVEVSLPHTDYAVAAYYVLATAEASAILRASTASVMGIARTKPQGLLDHYERTRAEGFGPEVKRRIILGTYVLSSGYYDAYYLHAQKVRELIRRDFTRVFQQVDALLSPTSPIPAFKIGARASDPLQYISRGHLHDRRESHRHLRRECALRFCLGAKMGTRLPVGLQLLARRLTRRVFCKSPTPTNKAPTGTGNGRLSRRSVTRTRHEESLLRLARNRQAFRATLWIFGAVLLVFAAIPIANALLGEEYQRLRALARHRPADRSWPTDLSGGGAQISLHVSAERGAPPRADQLVRQDRPCRHPRARNRGRVGREHRPVGATCHRRTETANRGGLSHPEPARNRLRLEQFPSRPTKPGAFSHSSWVRLSHCSINVTCSRVHSSPSPPRSKHSLS